MVPFALHDMEFLDLPRDTDDFYLAIVLRHVSIILQAVERDHLDSWATTVADMMDFNPSEPIDHLIYAQEKNKSFAF